MIQETQPLDTKTTNPVPDATAEPSEPSALLAGIVAETTAAQRIYEKMGDPMAAAREMGAAFAASQLLGVRTPEQGFVMALTCILEGITPLEFARTYDIIEGKLAKKAAAQQAQFQAHGGRIDWLVYTDEEVRARFSHPRLCPAGAEIGVALKVLQERGVTRGKEGEKANYKRFPRRMLKARCVSEGISLVDPSINAGYYTPEEIEDEAPERPASAPGPAPAWAAPQAKPEEAPAVEPEAPKGNNGQRAKKVIAAFKSLGVLQGDLEAFAGNFETRTLAADWTEDHFAAFTHAKKQIEAAPLERRAEVAREVFQIEPGAQG